MLILAYVMIAGINGYFLYDSIKNDVKWTRKFKDLGGKMPRKLVALGLLSKIISAVSCAWFIYRIFEWGN